MPPRPRGKGKATMATVDKIRETVRGNQQEKGERPPTTAEFQAMMAASGGGSAAAAASSSSSLSGAAQQQKEKGSVTLHKGGKTQGVSASAFIPPGADFNSRHGKHSFKNMFESHFLLPPRLRTIPSQLVEGVNDFHYAMMNDLPRNEFYYNMLKENIVPGETTVLEIGAGSGLLSMMAASLGAKWVIAVEGSTDMAKLAQKNIDANKFTEKVRVFNKMSSELEASDLPDKPDILVSEIFGTLLLGESALDYLEDIRQRGVVRKDTKILPRFGRQYCCLVECPVLEQISGVTSWKGIDLNLMNSLRDTASVVFTKKYGFRMSSVPFKRLSEPITLLDLDFSKTNAHDVDMEFSVEAKVRETGTAHAIMYWWQSWNNAEDIKDLKMSKEDGSLVGFDQTKVMSTCPTATLSNFPRDMQWGQALQLFDAGMGPLPTPLVIDQKQKDSGEVLSMTCRTSEDRVVLQMELDSGSDGVPLGMEDDGEDGDDGRYDDEEECCEEGEGDE